MKYVIVLAFVAVATALPGEFYDEKYENFNVKEVVGNLRLLKSYSLCFRDEGKCTAEGQDLKKLIPEASKTNCEKCTEKQKLLVGEFMTAMIAQLPEEWNKLNQKIDPEQQYQDRLKEFLDKYGPK